MRVCSITFAIATLSVFRLAQSHPYNQSLPTVDLGYDIHQAISFNETGNYYNFSNIRFGQPPVGELRWAPPMKPSTNRSSIQTGNVGRICTQAFPMWYLSMVAELEQQSPPTQLPPPDPRENEDCLFLNVIVPKPIFDRRENLSGNKTGGSAVMVWIYGGGFVFTDNSYNPSGLIDRSMENGGEGVIYVEINYRGGAFGFLSGPQLRANGTANVGLLDQRLALEWVQEYICLFGGDPARVTAFGQSAGAASIMHQITAYGGIAEKTPFSQAIMASPAFQPIASNYDQNVLYTQFLAALNVSTIQDARQLPYEVLVAANNELVTTVPNGQFGFSPTVDGSFVPALPGELLQQGLFDKNVTIIVGHNSDEALFWINPNETSLADYNAGLLSGFPTMPNQSTEYIDDVLYPFPTSSNVAETAAIGYTTSAGHEILTLSDVAINCNAYFLASAFALIRQETYAYEFSVPPGYHGQDVFYFFYNGPAYTVQNTTIALAMQTYYTQFAMTGTPNNNQYPDFIPYGSNSTLLNLNVTGIGLKLDPADNDRCRWWQQALYF